MASPMSAADLPSGAAPQLRSSCDACNAAKVKCSKGHPQCRRCEARDLPCVYGISMRSAMGRNYRSNSEAQALAYYGRMQNAPRQSRPSGPYLHEPEAALGRSHSAHSTPRSYLSEQMPPAADSPMSSSSILPNTYHPTIFDPNSHAWPGAESLPASDPSFMTAPMGYLPQGAEVQDQASQYLQQHLQHVGFNPDFPVTQPGEGYSMKPSLDLLASPVQMDQGSTHFASCLCQQNILRQLYELSLTTSGESPPLAKAVATTRAIVETCSAAVECQHHRDLQDNLSFFLSLISLLVRATNFSTAGPATAAPAYSSFSVPHLHAKSIGSVSSVGSGLDVGDYYDMASSVGHISAPLTPRSAHGTMDHYASTPPPGLMPVAAQHMLPSPQVAGTSYPLGDQADESLHRHQLRAEMNRVQQLADELERRFAEPSGGWSSGAEHSPAERNTARRGRERRAEEDKTSTEARVVGLLLSDLKKRLRRNEHVLGTG